MLAARLHSIRAGVWRIVPAWALRSILIPVPGFGKQKSPSRSKAGTWLPEAVLTVLVPFISFYPGWKERCADPLFSRERRYSRAHPCGDPAETRSAGRFSLREK